MKHQLLFFGCWEAPFLVCEGDHQYSSKVFRALGVRFWTSHSQVTSPKGTSNGATVGPNITPRPTCASVLLGPQKAGLYCAAFPLWGGVDLNRCSLVPEIIQDSKRKISSSYTGDHKVAVFIVTWTKNPSDLRGICIPKKLRPFLRSLCFLKQRFLGSSIFGVVFSGAVKVSSLTCQDYFCWLPIPTLIAEGVPSLEGKRWKKMQKLQNVFMEPFQEISWKRNHLSF